MPNNDYTGTISLMGTMLTMVVVLLVAWFLLRWLMKRMPAQNGSRYIKLLDRVAVAPDKFLVLVRVAEKTMLVAMSSHTVEKLCDIDDPDHQLNVENINTNFKDLFTKHMHSKKGNEE